MESAERQGETEASSCAVLRRQTDLELSLQEAFQLLKRDDIVTTAVLPVRPKAGEVYLFKPDEESNAGK